jgi:hypothetical protein
MMSVQGPAESAEERHEDDAALVAQSLHRDFIGLIAIFDRQLAAHCGDGGRARSRITDARGAAERGLQLSRDLIELLRPTG